MKDRKRIVIVTIVLVVLFLLGRTIKAETVNKDIIYEYKTGQVIAIGEFSNFSDDARVKFNNGKSRIVTLPIDSELAKNGLWYVERVIYPPYSVVYTYFVDNVDHPTKVIQRLK